MNALPDPQKSLREYARSARECVYSYVRAVAMGEALPRKPEEYEWLLVQESEYASNNVKELAWKQYIFERFGWGSPVTWADLEKLAEDKLTERQLQDRLWEIEREIKDLEDERDELEEQLYKMKGRPEREFA